MPIKVKKTSSKKNPFVVTDGIKVFGRHPTKPKAEAQRRAIAISKRNKK